MLIIAERMLHIVNGHEHSQIKAIRAFIPNAPVEVLASREFENAGQFGELVVQPKLSTSSDIKEAPEKALAGDISVLAETLLNADSPPSLLVPSGNVHELRVVLGVAERLPDIRIAARVFRPEPIEGLTKVELDTLRELTRSGRVTLHSETVEVSTYFKKYHDLTCTDNLLLPCSIDPSTERFRERAAGTSKDLRVGYLGIARKEKGRNSLHLIVAELARQLRSAPGGDRVELILQSPFRGRFKLSNYIYLLRLKAIEAFGRHKGRLKLTWYQGNLSPEAFQDMIHSLDVSLLPYDVEQYRHRGSGLVLDSVLAGVPIVHSAGIGMSRFLSEGNAIAASDPSGFAAAILQIGAERETLDSKLRAARDVLLGELNRTQSFLNDLVNSGSRET